MEPSTADGRFMLGAHNGGITCCAAGWVPILSLWLARRAYATVGAHREFRADHTAIYSFEGGSFNSLLEQMGQYHQTKCGFLLKVMHQEICIKKDGHGLVMVLRQPAICLQESLVAEGGQRFLNSQKFF